MTDPINEVKGISLPDVLPVLPLRDTVAFPSAVIPLLVGQERSVKLVDDAMRANRLLILTAQKSPEVRPPGPNDIYHIGTAAVIQQLFRAQDGTIRLLVQGIERVRLLDFVKTEPYLIARIEDAGGERRGGRSRGADSGRPRPGPTLGPADSRISR